jgi:nucleotide sugar dehydrogenase
MTGREASAFAESVRRGDATVAIVGLGYVGLPLAMAFAASGLRTIGLDVDDARVAALQAGRSHVDDVPDSMLVAAERFEATADPAVLAKADAIFLCVPTPFDSTKTPDLDYVRQASATVGARLVPGQLVILQSTTSPGTTTDIVQPILEQESGLRAGVDFHLAYSPERVDPANTTWTLANTPKVCGGITRECGEMTRVLLTAILEDPSLVTVVSSPKVAELSKLAENTYRAVNIAYVNELAMLAHEMDIDIWEVM